MAETLPTWEELVHRIALAEARRLHRLFRPDSPGVRQLYYDAALDIDIWQRGTVFAERPDGGGHQAVGSPEWWQKQEFFARGAWNGHRFQPEHPTMDELIDALFIGLPASEWMTRYAKDRLRGIDRGAPSGQRSRPEPWQDVAAWLDKWTRAALDVKWLTDDCKALRIRFTPVDRVPPLEGWNKYRLKPTEWKEVTGGFKIARPTEYARKVVADHYCVSPETLRTDYIPRALGAHEDATGRIQVPAKE